MIGLFKRKTKFEKFADSLPAKYKDMAESLWADLEEKRVAREHSDVGGSRVSRFPMVMRRPTTIVLVCAAAVLILVLLFPPFYVQLPQITLSMGHYFLLNPPKYGAFSARIDGIVELAEIIGVLGLGGIAFLIARRLEDALEGAD